MLIFQVTATLNLTLWIPLISTIMSVIVSVATILKVRHENKEKMATKAYVLDKVSNVDIDIVNIKTTVKENRDALNSEIKENREAIESKIKEHKLDNLREHDNIKNEFNNTVKQIDAKLNIVLGFMNKGDKSGN